MSQTRTVIVFESLVLLSPYGLHIQLHCEETLSYPVCLTVSV